MQGSFKRRQEGLMVRHLFVYKSFFRDQSFELSGVPGIERVGPIRILRAMTPVFVHPHPRPGLRAHDRLEGIPARLRNFARAGVGTKINWRMKNHTIPSSRQRLAMGGNKGGSRSLLEPDMGRGNTGMQSKTANRDGRRIGENRQINQHSGIATAAQSFEESKNSPGACGERMAGLFAPAPENRIK